jgi:threonine synthase
MSAYLGNLACPRCHHEVDEAHAFALCPGCAEQGHSVNALPAYDIGPTSDWHPDRSQPGIFAYRQLLPIDPKSEPVSLYEGGTPLIPLRRTAERHGIAELYLKDESRNPTWSYKDRLAAIAVTKARDSGAETVVVSSTGNHGAAAAAYAAAAGLRCVVLTMESVPLTMKVLIQSYGADVFALRSGPERWDLMGQTVRERGWVPLSGYFNPPAGSNPFGVDGYKTIAFEIVESLGRAPDVIVMPVAYGDGIMGVYRGFHDLVTLGVIERLPRLVAAEPLGPYSLALAEGRDPRKAIEPRDSVAFSIATHLATYQGLHAIRASGGAAAQAGEDAEILSTQLQVSATEGVYLEASSVTALAVLDDLCRREVIGAADTVVCVGSSTGLKDIGATASVLPTVPVIAPTLDALDAATDGRVP